MRALPYAPLLLLAACGSTVVPGPERSCESSLRFAAAAEPSVTIEGEWSGLAAEPMERRADGTWAWHQVLEPRPQGYAYRFGLADGGTVLDPLVDRTRWVGQAELSRLLVPDCHLPRLEVQAFAVTPEGELTIEVQALRGAGGKALAAPKVRLDGQPLDAHLDPASGRLSLAAHLLPTGKHQVQIEMADQAGGAAAPLVLPFWVEATPFDWRDAVLYFAFTDRFRNGNPDNDSKVAGVDDRANFAGGDFAGLTATIEEGYFEKLGVNALWISPVEANAEGAWAGTDGRQYSGYHGYWPAGPGLTQARFGTRDELEALVAAAHRHGLRVVADVVLNHVHEQHPWYRDHRADGWFNVGNSCVCGSPGCDWDARALDCWFTPYLPDLDWRSSAMGDELAAGLRGWLVDVGFDGLRIDAAKHLLPTAIRTARAEVRDLTGLTNATPWLVGETFTGSDGHDLLNRHVGPHELDGQFEFSLYWSLVDAFAHGQPLTLVDAALRKSDAALLPTGLFSPFLGNHDLPRFASLAAGQVGADPQAQAWGSPLPQSEDDAVFARIRQAFTVLLAQPGVPLIYYGDEVALAGAGDPDNRRLMPWTGVSPRQADLRTYLGKLALARRGNAALRRGVRDALVADDDVLVFQRTDGAEVVVVAVNRGATTKTVAVPLARGAHGSRWVDLLGGAERPASGSLTLEPGTLAWLSLQP